MFKIKFPFSLLILFTVFPFSLAFSEEVTEVGSSNTSTLETDVHTVHIQQTIERLKELEKSVFLELHPFSGDSPSLDFDVLLPGDKKSIYPISRTYESLLKEQLIASKGASITPKFEEIFLLLSDEVRVKACKKMSADNPQEFAKKLVFYLGKGLPEQALIINQILPYLKDELEENLVNLLQNNPPDIIEKRAIIYALGRIKSEKSVSLLWKELQTTPSEDVKYTCVQALANMPHALSLEQWAQLIQSDSVPISLTSAYAIVEYGGSYAEEYIRRIFLGEFRVSQKVLEYLIERISNYPLEILVPFSIEVMSRNPTLAQRFSSLLNQKTGVNWGANPQLWANWWKEYLNSNSPAENTEKASSLQNNPPSQPDIKVHQPKIKKH